MNSQTLDRLLWLVFVILQCWPTVIQDTTRCHYCTLQQVLLLQTWVSQVAKKFPACNTAWRHTVITTACYSSLSRTWFNSNTPTPKRDPVVVTRGCHWSLFKSKWFSSNPIHQTKIRNIVPIPFVPHHTWSVLTRCYNQYATCISYFSRVLEAAIQLKPYKRTYLRWHRMHTRILYKITPLNIYVIVVV